MLVPLVLVTMAVSAALGDLAADDGRGSARAASVRLIPPVALAVGIAVILQVVLLLTVVGGVLALVVLVFTSLVIPCCVLEACGGREALRRSRQLVRGRSLRVLAVTLHSSGLALLAGPLVGITLMFVNSSTVPAIDLVSSIVYAAVLPYAAIVQTLLYYDARARRTAHDEATVPAPVAPATGYGLRPRRAGGRCGRRAR